MPKNSQSNVKTHFAPVFLPWVLGGFMLVIYLVTLNSWMNSENVTAVAQVSGFVWAPKTLEPLAYLATLPFHCLPAAKVPWAMNLFSAICGALILTILARCVAILPQDRTELQRQREKSDFGFLTGWQSYFPPALAVLLTGLQMTFWTHATCYSSEMINGLLFAVIAWQLLEYRLDETPWRLLAAAFAYGIGLTESTVFVSLFPVFLVVIIWMKKLDFLNLRFLFQLVFCGLAGLTFIFLLPLAAKFAPHFKLGVWDIMRQGIHDDWAAIRSLKFSDTRIALAQASLTTVLPLLLMAIRWSSSYGDNSRIGTVLASTMFHMVHGAVFTVCAWVMFDPPFSPQQILGVPSVCLSFLTALGIGYCFGYFLLIFSRKPVRTRRDPNPLPVFPPGLMWLCPIIIAGVFVCAATVLGTLIYRNRPIVKDINDNILLKYAQLTCDQLPDGGAILLCDSEVPGQNQPFRTLLYQMAIARKANRQAYPILDTQSLGWVGYQRFMHDRYPEKIPSIPTARDMDMMGTLGIYNLVLSLAESNNLCYLNPSYGYYFEQFYAEPHGMVYVLKKLPKDTGLPPALDKQRMAENEVFWDQAAGTLAASVQKAVTPPNPTKPRNAVEWILEHLHPVPVVNEDARLVGYLCSRCLDDWGVQLQRAGELDKAAKRFNDAKVFNPDNFVADVNLAFNQALRTGGPYDIDPSKVNVDQFGKYRNWNNVVNINGPYDDISYCLAAAGNYFQDRLYHQAVAQYERVRQVIPDNAAVRVQLAQIYDIIRLPDRALEALEGVLAPTNPAAASLDENHRAIINTLAAAAYLEKHDVNRAVSLFDKEVARHPDDEELLKQVTQTYLLNGLYTNALRIIDSRLAKTPDDINWLYGKAMVSTRTGAYEDSVKAMTRVLDIQTNDPTARFNRALAYFLDNKLDEARADYLAVQTTYTNAFQAAYGLGEIAWRKKENAEALRNYEIYLSNAPTNAPEYSTIRERVTQLRGK